MIDHIRPAQLSAWFAAAGPRPLVLDVREPWERQTASVHAQGFELLAIPMGALPASLAALDPAPAWAPPAPAACAGPNSWRSTASIGWPTSPAASMPGRKRSTPPCPATDSIAQSFVNAKAKRRQYQCAASEADKSHG